MVERSRHDSSRDLLEELEDGWAASPPPAVARPVAGVPRPSTAPLPAPAVASPAVTTALAEDEEEDERGSAPDLAALDEGWLDDLFPAEDDGDDEEEDEGEEPELPDEQLDPEAFALAKKARDERAAKKREKKRAKAEAKRARQKARAAAMRQKQKSKKGRPPTPPRRDELKKRAEPTSRSLKPTSDDEAGSDAEAERDLAPAALPVSRPKKTSSTTRRAPSRMASVKLLAIVLATLLALAAAVAAILR